MAGIIQREKRATVKDETIKYHASSFHEYIDNYCSVELEAIDRFRYVEVLIDHFERCHTKINEEDVRRIFEQTEADIDELVDGGDEAAFTLENVVNLIQLSTLAYLELDDQPPAVYNQWTMRLFKWLSRERDLYADAVLLEKVCSCIAVVEASCRPLPTTMSVYGSLSKIIDRVKDTNARGLLLRLATSIIANTEEERTSVAALIADAIASPAEELIIHGIRAAAIFLDRFGDEAGLDSEILEGEIPSAGQRECGVSKANIDRESRDVWAFVRSEGDDDGVKPREKLIDDIDHLVEGFAANEILRNLQRALNGSVANAFRRTRNSAFRIAQRALGYKKDHRDRAFGKGKHEEHRERDEKQKDHDKERSVARKNREKELEQDDE